ncbi:uncharacterized protein LOC124595693 [Schistocerca americana]|uniref:uncharacterized protein LOC124595693 n=1 Tax=Schistocerca americana TaxID=7009 RepID=UPI001F500C81|nr:uncharacterized protein LOC124595693 [Schistocerca americana]
MRATAAAAAAAAVAAAACLLTVARASDEREYFFYIEEMDSTTAGDYVKIPEMDVVKLSKECSYLDGSLIIQKDLPDNTMIEISPEKLVSNSWNALAPTGPMKLCEYMEQQKSKMEMIWRASNFTRECPVLKNDVILNQFTVMETVFPKKLDGDEWRVVIVFTIGTEEILSLKIHVIKLPIEKKKKCEELEDEDEEEEEEDE